ncbi:glycine receptor subunit alphaZ1-like isoform X2 [Dendronephthya gigantea]|nr:glycine receptor subunit alphaZ1-like isoform X2 [Dendronephthya gigantea]
MAVVGKLIMWLKMLWLLYFVHPGMCKCDLRKTGANMNATTCLNELLRKYDKRIRPGIFEKPTVVKVDILIANFWTIEEANMDFTVDFYLRQYWTDERLRFHADNKDQMLTLTSEIWKEIWIPSTYFIGSKKAYFHDVTTDNYLLQISQNGSIFFSMRVTVTTSCQLRFHRYPHDHQTCALNLESYGYKVEDAVYFWNNRNDNTSAVVIPSDLSFLQYEMTTLVLTEKNNSYNAGMFSSLKVKFNMKRRVGFFIIETYIPSCIIVALSWISFWIPPDSVPARVALGITTALTMVTISGSARAGLPRVSYVKAIDWYLLICLLFVFGAMLEYTLVSICYVKTKHYLGRSKSEGDVETGSYYQDKPEVDWLDSREENNQRPNGGLIRNGGSYLLRKSRRQYNSRTDKNGITKLASKDNYPMIVTNPVNIDRFARVVYLVLFVLFNILYWSIFVWL